MVHGLSDRSAVVFDDERVVVNAGLVLAVTLGRRLGLEQLVDAAVRLGGRPVHLKDITCPFLALIAEQDYVVPLEAAAPITSLVGSEEADELRLDAGHIGFVAGRQAAKENIPKIIDWLARHSDRLQRKEST